MNYLAHLALAGPTDASLIGNLLGDFAKGTQAHLLTQYPEALVEGMIMHREIDRYTDEHPAFKKAKACMASERRRFAGIALDIFYDHFLIIHWREFYSHDLDQFITEAYTAIDAHPEWWIGNFAEAYPYMKRQDWLRTYANEPGVKLTLERVSSRSPRLTPLAHCYQDFLSHFDELEAIFLDFFPELMQHAEQLILEQRHC